MTEVEQDIGREGTYRVKQALEGTTRFNIRYTVHDSLPQTEVLLLTGDTKAFDLFGDHLDPELNVRCPIYVESKNVQSGNHSADFKEFLAVAYSATKKWIEDRGSDPELDFMFAMICPWRGGTEFYEAGSETAIADAVSDFSQQDKFIPAGHTADLELIRKLAERLWVWVIPRRQEEMAVGNKALGWIEQGQKADKEAFAV